MNPQMPIYKPLDSNRSEIRLLEIDRRPEPDDGRAVHCRLRTVSLDEDVQFYALSYLWGDSTVTTDITVSVVSADGGRSPSHTLPVTVNLASALSSLPRLFNDRETLHLWADAICINQADYKERSSQVQLMKRIYETAEVVVSWLGNQGDEMRLGLDSLRIVNSELRAYEAAGNENYLNDDFFKYEWLTRHPSLLEQSRDDTGSYIAWDAMIKVLSNPYWNRVWVFQEIVLARRLMLAGSGRVLPEEDLNLIMLHLGHVRERGIVWPEHIPENLWDRILDVLARGLPAVAALRVRRMRQLTMTVSKQDSWLIQSTAIYASNEFEASDPKDHVYGILGVFDMAIVPDYSDAKSVADVYREFAAHWLELAQRMPRKHLMPLEFLIHWGAGLIGHQDGFSSWTRNLRKPANFRFQPPVWGEADWDVAGFYGDKGTYPLVQGESLFVTGTRIDSVASVAHIQDEASLLAYMDDFKSRYPTYITGMATLQAFIELLYLTTKAQDEPRAAGEPELYATALLLRLGCRIVPEIFSGEVLSNHRTPILELRSEAPYEQFPGTAYAEMNVGAGRVLSPSTALFETTSGYLGLAGRGVEQGDIVCKLKGIGNPVVLRKDGGHFIHVGAAPIVGLMGQVAGLRTQENLERFELR